MVKKSPWDKLIEKRIEKQVEDFKKYLDLKPKEVRFFRLSAVSRIGHISGNCVNPLKRTLHRTLSRYQKKPISAIYNDFQKIRAVIGIFPLTENHKLTNQILDHIHPFEIDFYEATINNPEIVQKIYDELESFCLKAGYIVKEEKKQSKGPMMDDHATRKILEKRSELYDRAFRDLKLDQEKRTLTELHTKRSKNNAIKGWRIVNETIWDIYLLLLPIYLSLDDIRRYGGVKNKIKKGLMTTDFLTIIAYILSSEIEQLSGLTAKDIKSRIQYILHDKKDDPSLVKLLEESLVNYFGYDCEVYLEVAPNIPTDENKNDSLKTGKKFDLKKFISINP